MNKEQLIAAAKKAGVVGAGGAGFPTAVKLNANPEYIVINGAECEPLLKVDQSLAEASSESLIEGLNLLVETLGAKEGIFALKAKYYGAVKALNKAAENFPTISIKSLGNYYPLGDEQILIYEVLGRIVAEGGLPLGRGAIVVNVESLMNLRAAAIDDRAVVEKYLTVTGEINKPATYKVPVGLSVREIIEASGGAKIKDLAVINGGPMMGSLIEDLNSPITKTTKGLIVLDRSHPLISSKSRSLTQMMRQARTACCHCYYCTDLCPRYLLGHRLYPDKVMRLSSYATMGEKGDSEFIGTEANPGPSQVFLCCECGLCELVCVMGLQPWRLNRELKARLGPEAAKAFKKLEPQKVNPFREFRRYPIPKLINKLGLESYDKLSAPLTDYPSQAKKVTLLLKQSLGTPSIAQVKLGDRVKKGEVVATPPQGSLGSIIHSSIDGKVEQVLSDRIVVTAD
ncbi:MAG: SLBB domain-containing protein [Deltaproteobacteria bacterium]|jgi:Na+-translocating ferredoxin:NAD+ oxidoreductase RnfC subunit|nr:SLBB domain-containing protein [Deltaproteobacteria bacterium]